MRRPRLPNQRLDPPEIHGAQVLPLDSEAFSRFCVLGSLQAQFWQQFYISLANRVERNVSAVAGRSCALGRRAGSMNLIDSVEVAYFRSIYKQRLSGLEDLSILFGRNDSGKSNFLRALNLFFNENTNPKIPFDFDRDLCHARRIATQDNPGAKKFVYVKIVFNTPGNYRKSLGDSFYVKKQWSITKQVDPHIETSVPDGSRHYLSRFLNQIRFHYIPAIKDRAIFETLLGRVYAVLAQQDTFLNSLDGFSNELRQQTSDLSSGLRSALKLDSAIAPPADLTDLFRSLDFETKGSHGGSYSLTLQRGDGVQVQHIPAILSFLSDRGKQDFHIWGFEEPENSLELANAISEAQRFLDYARTPNKQIFLTSHSAAFFSLDEKQTKRFYVHRDDSGEKEGTTVATEIHGLDPDRLPGELMGETPHLPVISFHLRESHAKVQSLKEHTQLLRQRLDDAQRPLLFVEGESDSIIVEAAWQIFIGNDLPFDVVDCEGTKNMEALSQRGKPLIEIGGQRQIFILVDNDNAGRALWNTGHLAPGGKWVLNGANQTYWCRLPPTHEFNTAMNSLQIPASFRPLVLENLFSRETRLRAFNDGAYIPTSSPYDELRADANCFKKIFDTIFSEDFGASWKIYITKPTPESKVEFARWISEKSIYEPDLVEPLRQTILDLQGLLE
ncbi:ATP-dependent nuclease [Wenzhouxiangella sediminis]|nr:AAA family ATPase [Wenzhouxiangella sediminis]